MIIQEHKEEQRSKAWRFVTTTATIVIILVVAFFITKLFRNNALEGVWTSEDDNVVMTIQSGERMTVEWKEMLKASNVVVEMSYTLDKNAKTIQLHADEESVEEALEKADGKLKKEQLKVFVNAFTTTFDYSLEQNELVLTEHGYGEQFVLIKR